MTNIQSIPQVEYESLPMSGNRMDGWDALRAMGRVVLMNGWYHLTRRDDVLHALRTPEVYSSKKAFDMLGSPLPLVPISFDPHKHTRFRNILQAVFSRQTLNAILPIRKQHANDIND